MAEQGPDGLQPTNDETQPPEGTRAQQPLGNPTRLVPRRPVLVEPERDITDAQPVTAPADPELFAPPPGGSQRSNPLFAPRSFGNGRVQVWGFAPGCLIASLIASVALTILLNMIF